MKRLTNSDKSELLRGPLKTRAGEIFSELLGKSDTTATPADLIKRAEEMALQEYIEGEKSKSLERGIEDDPLAQLFAETIGKKFLYLGGFGGPKRSASAFRVFFCPDDRPRIAGEIKHAPEKVETYYSLVADHPALCAKLNEFCVLVNTERAMAALNGKDLKMLTSFEVFKKYFSPFERTMQTKIEQEPASISWSTKVLTYYYFPVSKVLGSFASKEPPKAWNQFLSRIEDDKQRRVFCSFIWSIFNPKDRSRKVLWLNGSGNDGKSKVFGVIQKLLQNAAATFSAKEFEDNKFGKAELIAGKRLLVDPDCRTPYALGTEIMHKITGGDVITAEIKYGGFITIQPEAKVAILSNYTPQISGSNNEKSRLLFVKVSTPYGGPEAKQDYDWPKQLRRELWSFLRLCKNIYEEDNCVSGIQQDLPELVLDYNFLELLQLFHKNYAIDLDGDVPLPLTILRKTLKVKAERMKLNITDATLYALQRELTEKYRCRIDGVNIYGVKSALGISDAPESDTSEEGETPPVAPRTRDRDEWGDSPDAHIRHVDTSVEGDDGEEVEGSDIL